MPRANMTPRPARMTGQAPRKTVPTRHDLLQGWVLPVRRS